MNDLFTPPQEVVSVRFPGSDRTYDYFAPAELKIAVGQKVVVMTRRGEATVEVVDVKQHSDVARVSIIRIA